MSATQEMPKYKSHKTVHALKIKEVAQSPADFVAPFPGGSYHIIPEHESYLPFPVSADWVEKHRPHAGGYYVRYDDGYTSFSPAAAFENGYTRTDNLSGNPENGSYLVQGAAPTVGPHFNVRHLPAAVFPSTTPTIMAIVTDEKFNGAHNYNVRPMTSFDKNNGGAQYADEAALSMDIVFVKRNEDGSWQAGLQTEQLLYVLIDRHEQMNNVFPSAQYPQFLQGISMALQALGARVVDRQDRGVMGEHKT